MTWDAFMGRVRGFLARDWHTEAKEVVARKYDNAPEWQHLAMDTPHRV